MTRYKQIIMSVLAVLILAAAIWLMWPEPAVSQSETAAALRHGLKAGEVIKEEDLLIVDLPSELMTDDMVKDHSQAVGMRAAADLFEGELLIKNRLTSGDSGMSYTGFAKGTRLMTIQLPPDRVNGYWLASGNRVDIDLVARGTGDDQETISIENILVAEVLSRNSSNIQYDNQAEVISPLLCLALDRDQARIIAAAVSDRDIYVSVICD